MPERVMTAGYKPSVWRKIKACHLKLYPECRICEDPNDVVVHHVRYRGARGTGERPGDLVTLCKFHHDDFHRIYGRAGHQMNRGESLVDNTLAYISEKRAEIQAEGF